MNNDPSNRLDQLLEKMSNKKAMELTGKTNSQIEKTGNNSKTFKAFEAKFEKIS